MNTNEIRQSFLNYFAEHGHRIVPSSSLVPANDPTLLFTNAGMVQFKDLFLGYEKRDYARAVTAQRCVRAGGKHNDLENVGYTARHHTFFEMLGNFSFGDYFKKDAVEFAWRYLTETIGLPAERLWVTVFEDDDEAADLWLDHIGIDAGKFARIGAEDNFWAMGDTGPCGPCSEIFYDHGPSVAGGPPGSEDADGDRYIEIWNLVFMQFDRQEDGELKPLPKPSVDTGMGLERLATILQGVHNNYDIDLFRKLIEAAARVTGTGDLASKSLRVIADHIRSTSFLITDGVLPANEGRGYVLRRIIRRAIRHGYQLGRETPFMHELVGALDEQMGDAYPELRDNRARVEKVLRTEGERFAETLSQGIRLLEAETGGLAGGVIPGDLVFRLYDTFGFPADLTADYARERDLELDMEGFEQAMADQRRRARAASQFKAEKQVDAGVSRPSDFTGYDHLDDSAEVAALVIDGVPATAAAGQVRAIVVLDRTPFYAESGGQVGDRGSIGNDDFEFRVDDTQKLANGAIGHFGEVISGRVRVGDRVRARVDSPRRQATVLNHSATHLLHAALKHHLGSHVQQRGSLVAPERLRFDFSHGAPMSAGEIAAVEAEVNREIRANLAVGARIMDLDKAKAAGAEALFGEKYDQRVRVIGMGDYSLELCGGTHVDRTGDIGLFKIIAETGVAAGVRRIEAVTGQGALAHVADLQSRLAAIARSVKSGPEDVEDKVGQLLKRIRDLEKQNRDLMGRLAAGGSEQNVSDVAGVKVAVARHDDVDNKDLRDIMDRLRDRIESGVVVVGGANRGKAVLVCGVTGDLTGRISAGDIIADLSSRLNGKGGGRRDMAQGGGESVEQLDTVLSQAGRTVESLISA